MPPFPGSSVAVAGIFVGGESRRMGGRPKGLLVVPPRDDAAKSLAREEPPIGEIGETIVARWKRMFDALGIASVLVGRREAYATLGIACIDDDPPGIGPLGGLLALLKHARGGIAIAVACDMPFVSDKLLEKLVGYPSHAAAVAPTRGAMWDPLFARYMGPRPLEVATTYARGGGRSLHGVLDRLGAEALPLSDTELEELRDWDDPASERMGRKS
jgi:molybdopterin-guanine dinucleotide biosynthesis protein A